LLRRLLARLVHVEERQDALRMRGEVEREERAVDRLESEWTIEDADLDGGLVRQGELARSDAHAGWIAGVAEEDRLAAGDAGQDDEERIRAVSFGAEAQQRLRRPVAADAVGVAHRCSGAIRPRQPEVGGDGAELAVLRRRLHRQEVRARLADEVDQQRRTPARLDAHVEAERREPLLVTLDL